MLEVLVVEDNTAFYENELLRFFKHLLPMDQIKLERAMNVEKALSKIIGAYWDVILMDYAIGLPVTWKVPEDWGWGSEHEPMERRVKNGADLIKLRRGIEGTELEPVKIIGIAAFQISNAALVKAGADTSIPKGSLEAIAKEVARGLKTDG